MTKRNLEVTGEMIDAFKCTDFVKNALMVPKNGEWGRDKHWNVICTFQRIQVAIKYMEPPDPATFDSWFDRTFAGKSDPEDGTIAQAIKAVVDGGKCKLHGWNDLFAGFCIVNAMFDGEAFKKVVSAAFADEVKAVDLNNNTRIRKIDAVDLMIGDDLQARCMKNFFGAILDKDTKRAIQMKNAIAYPLGAQTKEEKMHQDALAILREQKEEEDF